MTSCKAPIVVLCREHNKVLADEYGIGDQRIYQIIRRLKTYALKDVFGLSLKLASARQELLYYGNISF